MTDEKRERGPLTEAMAKVEGTLPTLLEQEKRKREAECPDCGGERNYIPEPDGDGLFVCYNEPCQSKRRQERQEVARQERIERANDVLHELGVPRRYLHCSRGAWDEKRLPWPKPIHPAWEIEPGGVTVHRDLPSMTLIWGPTGCGKTHVATAIFREVVLHLGGGGLWAEAMEVIERQREAVRWKQEDHHYREALSTPILVLDDFGTNTIRTDTTFPLDRLGYLLRHRYNEVLPTIITTNNSAEQLMELDSHLASRLLSEIRVPMKGDDARLD